MATDRPEDLDRLVGQLLTTEDGVLGSYVIIAEVVHPETTELRVAASEGSSPWLTQGMIVAAQDIVSSALPYSLPDLEMPDDDEF